MVVNLVEDSDEVKASHEWEREEWEAEKQRRDTILEVMAQQVEEEKEHNRMLEQLDHDESIMR